MAEGSTLITINPATLDDEEIWRYNDLRGLCKQLGLSARGKRMELVDRLQGWHKLRVDNRAAKELRKQHKETMSTSEEDEDDNWIELNVDGSNFSILSQNVKIRTQSFDSPVENQGEGEEKAGSSSGNTKNNRNSTSETGTRSSTGTRAGTATEGAQGDRCSRRMSLSKAQAQAGTDQRRWSGPTSSPLRPAMKNLLLPNPSSARKQRAIWNFGNAAGDTTVVSPTLLRPLTTTTGNPGTPGKSILKWGGVDGPASPRSPRGGGGCGVRGAGAAPLSASKIHFSPFNGTKVIGNRRGVGNHSNEDSESDDSETRSNLMSENEDDEEDEDWDENYVDAIARSNAERNTLLAEGSLSGGEGFGEREESIEGSIEGEVSGDGSTSGDGIDSGSLWERID